MTIHGMHSWTLASSLAGNLPSKRSKSANIGAIARIIASKRKKKRMLKELEDLDDDEI